MSSPVISEAKWMEAERKFIEGHLQLTQIAEQYGVKHNTVRRRAQMQGWGKLRRQYRERLLTAPPPGVQLPSAIAAQNGQTLPQPPEYYSRLNKAYVAEAGHAGRMAECARENYFAALDGEEAAKWMTCYDRALERQRVLMGIPLPAPLRQREKQGKGSTITPIELPPDELNGLNSLSEAKPKPVVLKWERPEQ